MLVLTQDVVPCLYGTRRRMDTSPWWNIDDTYVWDVVRLISRNMLVGQAEARYLLSQGFSPRRSIYLAFEDEEVLSHAAPLGLQRLYAEMRALASWTRAPLRF